MPQNQHVNYDILFEQARAAIDRARPPRLLLHVCCAPCATACLLRLVDCYDVTLYYANDNIMPADEWNKRLGELRKLTAIVNDGKFEVQPVRPLTLVVQDYDVMHYLDAVRGLEAEPEGGTRCVKCFELRLTDARRYAEQHGFDLFTTTLTVSPYKNSRLLNEIGMSLQTDALRWLPTDFKKHGGYNESIRLCEKYGIYRQHYCGCTFAQK